MGDGEKGNGSDDGIISLFPSQLLLTRTWLVSDPHRHAAQHSTAARNEDGNY